MSMRKIKSLFMALAALMLSMPCLHAQNYIIGAPVPLEDELDGMEVVFEGYSDDSNLGSRRTTGLSPRSHASRARYPRKSSG